MARNRRHEDRDAKRDEIIAAARSLFISEGFELTTMNRLAKSAGVAPNTVYWYFKDKDEVLLAVLDLEFQEGLGGYLEAYFEDVGARMLWVIERLDSISSLVNTVHARVDTSEAIRTWHDRFHAITEGMLRAELIQLGVDAERADALVKVYVFTVEGVLSHGLSQDQRRQVCLALAAQV